MSATPPHDPAEPGRTRLARPPSERYAAPEPEAEARVATGSLVRATLAGDLAALAGAAVAVVLGAVLAVSAGLVVLWASAGYLVGVAVRVAGGTSVRPPIRRVLAIVSALAGVAIAQLGLWWYAGLEGGVLPFVEYLAQTFGLLVPVQAVAAAAAAWWSAR